MISVAAGGGRRGGGSSSSSIKPSADPEHEAALAKMMKVN
jgi:hypothetical protein